VAVRNSSSTGQPVDAITASYCSRVVPDFVMVSLV
jgi:hypothetical protein